MAGPAPAASPGTPVATQSSVTAPPPPPPVVPPERHVAALANAIGNGWRPYRWRAYGAAALGGLIAGGVVAPVVTTSLILVLATLSVPSELLTLRIDELLWYVVFAATFGAIAATAFVLAMPRELRAAAETYVWLATRAERNWRRDVGRVRVPRKERQVRAFLATAPERPETAAQRFGGWIAVGDLARAEAAIDQIPNATDDDRYTRASARWLLDFVRGGTEPPDVLEPLAAAIDDPDEQIEARVDIAAKRARFALAQGGDWRAPLADVRPALANAPVEPFRRRVWWPIARTLALSALGGFTICWLVWTLFLESAINRLVAAS